VCADRAKTGKRREKSQKARARERGYIPAGE
jgi:hypothetical protein